MSKRVPNSSPGWMAGLGLQPARELFPDLLDLGRDGEHAIRLIGMVLEVVLVILLGGVKRGSRLDRGDDRVCKGAVFRKLGNYLLRCLVLLFIAIKNHRAILLADVVALAV